MASGSAEASALPEALYLGFFSRKGSGKVAFSDKPFRNHAQSLFAELPPLLHFSSVALVDGKWYIVPETPLSGGILAAADSIAEETGFSPMESPPLSPGRGFFAGNNVTPPPFGAFSFRHLDALLYRIESDSRDLDRAWWTVLARTSRRIGAH